MTPPPFLRWRWPAAFVALLALLHLLGAALPPLQAWAVWPGELRPWWGPWTFHLRHASGSHLWSNAVPLLALGVLFGSVYPKAAPRAWVLFLLGVGPLLWIVGRAGPHVGASGLVYALFHALVALALLRRDRAAVASMFAATAVFSGLWLGALRPEEGVSWEGHLAGAVLGWAAALAWFRQDPKPLPPAWDDDEDVSAPEAATPGRRLPARPEAGLNPATPGEATNPPWPRAEGPSSRPGHPGP